MYESFILLRIKPTNIISSFSSVSQECTQAGGILTGHPVSSPFSTMGPGTTAACLALATERWTGALLQQTMI